MAPVQRIQNICLKPKQEWDVIAGESSSTADLLKNYALPVAAIGAVAGFIGSAFVGRYMPIASALVSAVLWLGISIAAAYAIAQIIDALAPNFGGEKNRAQALKVARPTPAGHDVCTFHVVVVAACALPMNGAARAVAVAATPVRTNARRPVLGSEGTCVMIFLSCLQRPRHAPARGLREARRRDHSPAPSTGTGR